MMKQPLLVGLAILLTRTAFCTGVDGCLLMVEKYSAELPNDQIIQYAQQAVPDANYSIYQSSSNRFLIFCDKYSHFSEIFHRKTPRLWEMGSWYPIHGVEMPQADNYTAMFYACPDEMTFKPFIETCVKAFPGALVFASNGKKYPQSDDVAIVIIKGGDKTTPNSIIPFKIFLTIELHKYHPSNRASLETRFNALSPP